MNGLTFVWDEAKNRASRRRHGIAFEEAQTVFYDENAREYSDRDLLRLTADSLQLTAVRRTGGELLAVSCEQLAVGRWG